VGSASRLGRAAAVGLAGVLLVLAPGASSGRAAATLPAFAGTSTSGRQLYWGAWIGDQLTGREAPWDMSAVSAFESMTGKGVSLIHFASPFADCSKSPCSFYTFPTTPFDDIRAHGAIPFFSWNSGALPVTSSEPDFQLSDVIAGRYDAYIRSWARAAKAWGHPFFLRFDWEMNGSWFPWSEGVNGNRPGDFVRAWRHVHDIFEAQGAANATWVWCPNIDPQNRYTPLAGLYPGDAYVDWTCLDGYRWGASWSGFGSLFRSTYDQLGVIAPSKPVVVGETASTEKGGLKAKWITDLLTVRLASGFPRIRAVLWFEKYDSHMDWPIETSAAAEVAFAAGIRLPIYADNAFGSLGGGRVQPLP
jgi:hypothetical protein